MRKFGTFLALASCLAFTAVSTSFAAEVPKLGDPVAFVPQTGVPAGTALPAPSCAPGLFPVQTSAGVVCAQPPAAQPAPQALLTEASGGALSTFLNMLPGLTLVLGTLLAGIIKLAAGQKSDSIRKTVADVATAAWYVAERQGGTAAQKTAAALAQFHQGLTGEGVPLSAGAQAQAQTLWKGMSAAEGLSRAVSKPVAPPANPDPSPAPAQK